MSIPLRLLIIEDSEDDAELICMELERADFDVTWKRVETEDGFREALEESWDLIISDFQMPDFDGLRAFAIYKECAVDIPFIFVSGALGEERAVQAMRAGARDYLLKGKLARLNVAVKRELAAAQARQAQRDLQKEAEREQRRLSMAVEASGAGVFEHRMPIDDQTYYSNRWAEIIGYDVEELPPAKDFLDWVFAQAHPEDVVFARKAYRAFLEGETPQFNTEIRLQHREGHWVDIAAFAKALERDQNGAVSHVVGVMLDLTERRKLEDQLRQSQKMEAVGRLAGGIAHDFNNLLTAIFSFGEFVLNELNPKDPAYSDMREVLKAAKKAEQLTAQLLTFSRRKPVSPKILNLNHLLEDIDRMLRRVVGEDIDVVSVLAPDLHNVRIDPGSFEQVIINLAVNARDAMPEGGKLTIETSNIFLGEDYGTSHGVTMAAGSYICIALSDNGVGMEEDVQKQVFEPFFTTKESGRGTGLGLSTCYGIIKQASGYIWVYSEIGRGTSFKVYLPRAGEEIDDSPQPAEPKSLQGGETILLAEDDNQVRRIAMRALSQLGYQIIEASNGKEALEKAKQWEGDIHLLLTDVVMPEMGGKQLVEALSPLRPQMRILYMSGYTSNTIVHQGELDPGTQLLTKPFTPDILSRRVREVLDSDSLV